MKFTPTALAALSTQSCNPDLWAPNDIKIYPIETPDKQKDTLNIVIEDNDIVNKNELWSKILYKSLLVDDSYILDQLEMKVPFSMYMNSNNVYSDIYDEALSKGIQSHDQKLITWLLRKTTAESTFEESVFHILEIPILTVHMEEDITLNIREIKRFFISFL